MPVPLMRSGLRPRYERALQDPRLDAHPGLLLQRGLAEHGDGDTESKAHHIDLLCERAVSEFYGHAFKRWRRFTADESRFRTVTMALVTRLFCGLAGGGMLETGCAISHSHGAPYIPGSSLKGVVSAHARDRLGTDGRAICNELFGAPVDDESAAYSGLVVFHDAWWVPGSRERPLVQEIVTTHHRAYYAQEGSAAATDFDSPVPNPQVAVHGDFCFVIEGPSEWLGLSAEMLTEALCVRGVGAKTRSGYGIFATEPEAREEQGSEWLDRKIPELIDKHKMKSEYQVLSSWVLADAWSKIDDPGVKRAAFLDIKARACNQGWWETASRGPRSMRRAKSIYDRYAASENVGD